MAEVDPLTLELPQERRRQILEKLQREGQVIATDLSRLYGVSEDTIRRDLIELAEQGKVIKVHGGALSKSYHLSFRSSNIYSLNAKKSIAKKAVQLIKDGMFVLTTGGSTIIELAKALPLELSATFITGSIPAAYEYMHHPNIDLIFIGDKVSKNSQLTVGGEAISKIRQLNADLCFIGTNALDITQGLTDNDWDVVQVKKAMIESSEKVVSLSIKEKLNTSQRIKVCDIAEMDYLVTELEPDDQFLIPYQQTGIRIF